MSKTKSRSFVAIVVESLGWPLFWGTAATVAFYLLIGFGIIRSELVSRYFAGHPVEYVETALFFVAMMALLLKALDLAFQFRAIPRINLPEAQPKGDEPKRASELRGSLEQLSVRMRSTYLGRRLANALRYVERSESAEGFDDQLRYLSDLDAERSHDGYSLVRMIVWATPMLGFLGTVIGITVALGNLSPEALVNAPKDAMQGLLAGLSVAFDTTALALSLSIVLMFVQYLVREVETQLLTQVDRRTEDEMIGRFQGSSLSKDPHVAAVTRMSERVIDSVEQLTQRQTDVWGKAWATAQQEWQAALQSTNSAVQANFLGALTDSMRVHAEAMAAAEQAASLQSAEKWQSLQQEMQQQTNLLATQQESMSHQGEIMLRVLKATGEVSSLEAALNQNLNALASSKNFEDTVVSLSAAIQLLTTRMGVTTKNLALERDQEDRAA